jgi:hypothetical protein
LHESLNMGEMDWEEVIWEIEVSSHGK